MIQKALQSTGIVSLGFPSNAAVGIVVFQVIGATWSGSAVVKIREGGARARPGTPVPVANLVTTQYANWGTATIVAAGSPITTDGIYAVLAPGVEVVLDYTHTSGQAALAIQLLVNQSGGFGAGIPAPGGAGFGFFGAFFGGYFGNFFGGY